MHVNAWCVCFVDRTVEVSIRPQKNDFRNVNTVLSGKKSNLYRTLLEIEKEIVRGITRDTYHLAKAADRKA